MKSRNEAVIIRNRGGKLVELRLICKSSEGKNFYTDGVTEGSMDTKIIPKNFDKTMDWLAKSGKIGEVEKLLKYIFE